MTYHAFINQEVSGPHTFATLQELEAQGLIDDTTAIKAGNSEEWLAWQDVRANPPAAEVAARAVPSSRPAAALPQRAAPVPPSQPVAAPAPASPFFWTAEQARAERKRLREATAYSGLRLMCDLFFWLTMICSAILAVLRLLMAPDMTSGVAAIILAVMSIAIAGVICSFAQAMIDIADAQLARR